MDIFKDKNFKKWCWIELIGFDNTADDYGVNDFIERAGFVPTGISLLLSWLGFVFEHKGFFREEKLSDAECSYVGHKFCPERERQSWTNYQLKALVKELHSHGIKVYISFFNYCSYKDDKGNTVLDHFHELHPEVFEKDSSGPYISTHMLKRLNDGTFYYDELQKRTVQALNDYDFDGIQIADGISSPRLTVPSSICNDDILEQFQAITGIKIPAEANPKDFIMKECYLEYIKFLSDSWNMFYQKFYSRLTCAGKSAHFNNAWTTCAIESISRYGVDYRRIVNAGANSCIIEDVSGAVSVLANEYNGFLLKDEERRKIHYWFLSKLMINSATMPNVDILPITNIHDNMEQWGVYEHMRTYMQMSASCNLNSLIYTKYGVKPIIDGPLFCLCDSLKKNDWDYIKNVWNTAFTPNVYGSAGVTLVWNDKIIDKELYELYESRRTVTTQILTELLYAAAPVNSIVRIEDIESMPKPFGIYSGALLVINSDLYSEKELDIIKNTEKTVFIITLPDKVPAGFNIIVQEKNSFGGIVLAANIGNGCEVIENSAVYSFDSKKDSEPLNALWTHFLSYKPYSSDFWIKCGYAIQKYSNSPFIDHDIVTEYGTHRRICKYICVQNNSEKQCRLILTNDDYWYNIPEVTFNKKIKKVVSRTKYDGYELTVKENKISTLVPLRSAEIIDIEFE